MGVWTIPKEEVETEVAVEMISMAISNAINFPIIICLPEKFEGVENLNMANAGLYALDHLLQRALATQGYKATMFYGGLDKTVVLALQVADALHHV